ncbi:olfactory marker protein a [Latimeria chalumnae]|uniref:olfactory marker protein a n=1 Tax=Latimeria chalumnae TaxID=7897 RepID=UPI0003C16442|nr:PREDICTED: olfactory marker protein [Latimeria chalumnae]|eukprot:XP_006004323.1 PREDICTED: olfactory marker protein [Latimeria chalumnae]
MAGDSSELELAFTQDVQLTEYMRLRAQSLQQRNAKPQDGEKLLQPNEFVYRLDFLQQKLKFLRWNICLEKPGKIVITATSQHWTPDLTNLMTRQLLEPEGIFWQEENKKEIFNHEADVQEFGERIAELAKIRKAMYFLIAFKDGTEPANVKCSIVFKV